MYPEKKAHQGNIIMQHCKITHSLVLTRVDSNLIPPLGRGPMQQSPETSGGGGRCAKTLDRRLCTRGCVDLFIWFGGPLDKRFQGPSCAVSSSPNYRLLLVITVIKPSFYWLPQ
jgi:hypothetical protein